MKEVSQKLQGREKGSTKAYLEVWHTGLKQSHKTNSCHVSNVSFLRKVTAFGLLAQREPGFPHQAETWPLEVQSPGSPTPHCAHRWWGERMRSLRTWSTCRSGAPSPQPGRSAGWSGPPPSPSWGRGRRAARAGTAGRSVGPVRSGRCLGALRRWWPPCLGQRGHSQTRDTLRGQGNSYLLQQHARVRRRDLGNRTPVFRRHHL